MTKGPVRGALVSACYKKRKYMGWWEANQKLFLDFEPEGKQPPRRGLPLRTGESGVTMKSPTVRKSKLSLSSSPSVENLQRHFAWLLMVAETAMVLEGSQAELPTSGR